MGLAQPGRPDINLYCYVRGRPYIAIDPDGLEDAPGKGTKGKVITTAEVTIQAGPPELTEKELKNFGPKDQKFIRGVYKWVSDQIKHYESEIKKTEAKFRAKKWNLKPEETKRFSDRIEELKELRTGLTAELRAGIDTASQLLTLANVVQNEAGAPRYAHAARVAVAYFARVR